MRLMECQEIKYLTAPTSTSGTEKLVHLHLFSLLLLLPALIGFCTWLFFLTIPKSSYNRESYSVPNEIKSTLEFQTSRRKTGTPQPGKVFGKGVGVK